ncbi:unnamed protein product, partial [Adineta ricciae]
LLQNADNVDASQLELIGVFVKSLCAKSKS